MAYEKTVLEYAPCTALKGPEKAVSGSLRQEPIMPLHGAKPELQASKAPTQGSSGPLTPCSGRHRRLPKLPTGNCSSVSPP